MRTTTTREWTATWGTGVYQAGERHIVAMPTGWDRSTPRRLVIRCRGGSASTISDDQFYFVHWAADGFVVLSCDLGSLSGTAGLYGNDTVLARIATAWTWAKANLAVKTDKFVLSGGSRGSVDALNYLTRNAANVIACTLEIPPVNVEDVRANNRSNQQTAIETAYVNNAGWQAARPTRSPFEFAASVGATGVPVHVWSKSDDPISLPQYTSQFCADSGAAQTDMGAGGHSVPAANLPDISAWAQSYA